MTLVWPKTLSGTHILGTSNYSKNFTKIEIFLYLENQLNKLNQLHVICNNLEHDYIAHDYFLRSTGNGCISETIITNVLAPAEVSISYRL